MKLRYVFLTLRIDSPTTTDILFYFILLLLLLLLLYLKNGDL